MGRVCGALKRVDIVTYNTFISVISGFFYPQEALKWNKGFLELYGNIVGQQMSG